MNDPNRRTGRTTRMLADLLAILGDPARREVVIVAASSTFARQLERRLRCGAESLGIPLDSLQITGMAPDVAVRYLRGRRSVTLAVDHGALEGMAACDAFELGRRAEDARRA